MISALVKLILSTVVGASIALAAVHLGNLPTVHVSDISEIDVLSKPLSSPFTCAAVLSLQSAVLGAVALLTTWFVTSLSSGKRPLPQYVTQPWTMIEVIT